MTIVKPIGDFFPVTDDLVILNPCHVSKIAPRYHPLIDDIVSLYHEMLGVELHSLYLRGSVPRGTAQYGTADLDTLALVSDGVDIPTTRVQIEKRAKRVRARHGSVTKVEICLREEQNALTGPWTSFVLATQAVCIGGSDLSARLPPAKLNRHAYSALPKLRGDCRHVMKRLQNDISDDDVRKYCCWIMKRLVRAGFDLVMLEDGRYARDLYPCLIGFAAHYPEHAGVMKLACELAIQPDPCRTRLANLCTELGGWLCESYEKRERST